MIAPVQEGKYSHLHQPLVRGVLQRRHIDMRSAWDEALSYSAPECAFSIFQDRSMLAPGAI
jgi:hypothetical protein